MLFKCSEKKERNKIIIKQKKVAETIINKNLIAELNKFIIRENSNNNKDKIINVFFGYNNYLQISSGCVVDTDYIVYISEDGK